MNTGTREQAIGARAAFWRRLLSDLAIMTVIGVFLAIIGPFGSIEEPLPVRLVSWLAFSYVGYAIYSPMGLVVDRAERALDLPRGPLWFFAALAATVPMTIVVHLVQYAPRLAPAPTLEAALLTYFYVFVIGGGIVLLFNVIRRRSEAAPSAPRPSAPEPRAADRGGAALAPANPLLDQLPAGLGSDVIALEMEDHYVRVHTALGSELVLMRLRDAIAHVAHVEGRQVHRSWWVARLAIEDVKREGRNVRLVLARGIEAPVSRAQVSELRNAGWI